MKPDQTPVRRASRAPKTVGGDDASAPPRNSPSAAAPVGGASAPRGRAGKIGDPVGTPRSLVVRLAKEVDADWRAHLSTLVPEGASVLWDALCQGPVSLHDIESGTATSPGTAVRADASEADGATAEQGTPRREAGLVVGDAFVLLSRLWAGQALVLASSMTDAALEVRAGTLGEPLNLGVQPLAGRPWRASRFASLRGERGPDGIAAVTIEYPAGTVLVRIAAGHASRVAAFFASFLSPRDLNGADREVAGGGDDALLFLLAVAGVLGPADEAGRLAEDRDPARRQWEHHDLLMHFRSRQGRHPHDMGAGFRFKGVLDPQPVLKVIPWQDRAIALPRPDLGVLAASDPPFTAVLEMRRSIRRHDPANPIALASIGHFLYRSARVRARYQTEVGELSSRPYPSGGASYEMEIYLTVDHASDLARGFYYYDPNAHRLCLVRPPDDDMEGLLYDAWISSARMCRPQVLITLASRFQRVSWKYSGMAYAAQLKNVGVLYQTFYLVATAMNLAGCALGLGNTNRFARLTGVDYLSESSVGEFMLGTPAI